jgi:hypothetical protein
MSPTTSTRTREDDKDVARASDDALDALVERVGALDVREAPTTTTTTKGADEGASTESTFAHVLVLVGLRPDAKTRDIERALGLDTFEIGPKIVWVGKTRACAVFASVENADARFALGAPKLLGASITLLRWEKGNEEVSDVNTSELAPPKPRPRANASVARRMIANALNVKLDDATRCSAEEKKAQSDARKKRAEEKRRERERLACKGIE